MELLLGSKNSNPPKENIRTEQRPGPSWDPRTQEGGELVCPGIQFHPDTLPVTTNLGLECWKMKSKEISWAQETFTLLVISIFVLFFSLFNTATWPAFPILRSIMPPKCQKCPNTCYCVATFDCMHVILVTKYCIARLIAVEPALLLFFFFFPVWPVGSRKKKKKKCYR